MRFFISQREIDLLTETIRLRAERDARAAIPRFEPVFQGSLKPGSVLVLQASSHLNSEKFSEVAKCLRAQINSRLPDVEVMVLVGGIELKAVLSRARASEVLP